MQQDRRFAILGALAFSPLLAQGCAMKSGSGTGDERTAPEERIGEQAIKDIPPNDSGRIASRTSPPVRTDMIPDDTAGPTTFGEEATPATLMDVWFDFDRDSLRTDALPIVEANAKLLKEDSVTRVLLEGRGDEVGTAAYNIVLGERRARNVKSYLQRLGLSIDLKTTSYGKDRPLCFAHTHDCRQRNRSVHFVVKQ